MKRKGVIQASALLTCTVAVAGFVICSQSGKDAGAGDAQAGSEGGVIAGVAAFAENPETIEPLSIYAGITDPLTDFSGTLSVSGNEKQVVAQSDTAEKSSGDSEDGTFCGYRKLGIAGVDDTLNVRKKASIESDVVGKMTKHAACEIKKTSGEWTKIESGSVKGWVKSEYLLTGDKALKIAKKEVITVAKIKTETLRVRKKATTDAPIVSLVGEGEEFTVLKEKDGWVKVEVDDEKGFISTDYVDLSQKLTTAQSMKELKKGEDESISDTSVDLVSYALQFVGNRYVWGGESLTNGVDCSGFTMKIYQKYGIYLPHSSRAQPGCGRRVSASEAKPGDLFFYGSGNSINHVAIYIGNGQIVHASNHRDGIKISNAFYRSPITVARYLN